MPVSLTSAPADAKRPDVSFGIASYNCVSYLAAAVNSALNQRGVTVEVLIIDDCSSDDSFSLAKQLADDSRVRLFRTPVNAGPGGARNVALREMRGRWFAVLDSDDLIEPDRSLALITAADASGADMIADDLTVFGAGLPDHRFLGPDILSSPWLTLDSYFAASAIFGARPNPGFLKPMIRHDLLVRSGISYDDRLRIGEDDDLVIGLLMAGARYQILPIAGYRYRRHAASISHRLSGDHVDRMATAGTRLRNAVFAAGLDSPAFRARDRALQNAVAFTHAIEALKARRPFAALRLVLARPASARLFAMPLLARLSRFIGR